jgi:hypothetical protein
MFEVGDSRVREVFNALMRAGVDLGPWVTKTPKSIQALDHFEGARMVSPPRFDLNIKSLHGVQPLRGFVVPSARETESEPCRS